MTDNEFRELDQRGRKILKAYEVTFPQLLESKDPVVDLQGRMIGGQDRKNESPQSRWSGWQKSVQQAAQTSALTREVMEYFQATKHLNRPPQTGDKNIMQTGALDASLIPSNGPRFTWSPSKLMSFETCPSKFAAESYYKTVPYTESAQALWGTAVHLEAELFMKGEPVQRPDAFEVVKPYVQLLSTIPGERLIEYKIALDENWKPCEWNDGCARMILDLGIKDGKTLRAFDWKTGKMKESDIQMKIYAYALAICFPDVETFDFKYIWLKDKKTTGFKLERKELLPVAQDIRQRVSRMKEAWVNENFPMRKNGLCKNWCGNRECPYNGGGR